MLREDNIRIFLFAILCICFIFYLFMGSYSYKRDNKSKVNVIFFILCIAGSLWAIGYAFMLISPNIEIANIWRSISALGWCFFNGIWVSFAFSLKGINQKNSNSKIQFLIYITSLTFFIGNLIYEPSKVVSSEAYGFVDNLYSETIIGIVFSIYVSVLYIAGFVKIYFQMRNSHKKRVRKQMKIILISGLISFCLAIISDLILPALGIDIFPSGIISISIAMGGMWYAINKHKMMSISYELVSEYLFEAVNEPIFVLGEDFLVKNCNEASLIITGYSYKELKENSLDTIINFRNFKYETIMQTGNIINMEVDLYRKNKEPLVSELSATVIYDEYKDILGLVTLLHDVSERRNLAKIQEKYTLKLEESNIILKNEIKDRLLAEEQIRHFIYYDALTELSNRKKMLEDVNILLDNKNEKFAVLFIDLDNFKSANDKYGHESGDNILKIVALRLKSIIRSTDTISRIGGDEFIIILRDLRASANSQKIAEAVVETFNTAFIYKDNQLFIGVSIGISIFPEHGIDADTLVKKADLAMYEVKNSGGNGYSIYNDSINNNAINKLEMKKKLKNAMEKNEFITYYQPIMDLKSMKVLSAESLIRWKRGERIIPPIEFIPIAKSIGEIVVIDNWMLESACTQCKKWQELGVKDFSVSVNISYKQLIQLDFVQLVMNILHKHLLDSRYLNLEITEDEAMEDIDSIIKILSELKSQGIRISMDDFGTGYSSLSYINKLPIGTIKIDRSLIINLQNNSKNLVIIKSIVVMAHSLNIKVVAEGIETDNEYSILKELECDYIQGYLIGKPMTASDFQDNFIK
ncbi:MAG TPA: EAL domain-containing protein [Clostridiaceae bacterium]